MCVYLDVYDLEFGGDEDEDYFEGVEWFCFD